MSEVHYHVGSNTIHILRRQPVDYARSVGGHVLAVKFIAVPRNVDPYYNVPPPGSFGPFGRYYSGEWSEDDNDSRYTMRPEEEYVWPSPPSPPPYYAPFPHFPQNNVDPYYDVPPPQNYEYVPRHNNRYYPGEWMDVEHLSRFARRPEEEFDWTPPSYLPPPIAVPINSGIIVGSDEDAVLIQPDPNWVPNCNHKGLHGLPYVGHNVCTYHANMPMPHLYGPWTPDNSTDEEPYYATQYCECYVP